MVQANIYVAWSQPPTVIRWGMMERRWRGWSGWSGWPQIKCSWAKNLRKSARSALSAFNPCSADEMERRWRGSNVSGQETCANLPNQRYPRSIYYTRGAALAAVHFNEAPIPRIWPVKQALAKAQYIKAKYDTNHHRPDEPASRIEPASQAHRIPGAITNGIAGRPRVGRGSGRYH